MVRHPALPVEMGQGRSEIAEIAVRWGALRRASGTGVDWFVRGLGGFARAVSFGGNGAVGSCGRIVEIFVYFYNR